MPGGVDNPQDGHDSVHDQDNALNPIVSALLSQAEIALPEEEETEYHQDNRQGRYPPASQPGKYAQICDPSAKQIGGLEDGEHYHHPSECDVDK